VWEILRGFFLVAPRCPAVVSAVFFFAIDAPSWIEMPYCKIGPSSYSATARDKMMCHPLLENDKRRLPMTFTAELRGFEQGKSVVINISASIAQILRDAEHG